MFGVIICRAKLLFYFGFWKGDFGIIGSYLYMQQKLPYNDKAIFVGG
ncbi:hypothetical protein MuYL_2351 [Mucilaginibacter xinganensis]|uniref:Uncharacterized protein n=1 Tax=Mucilaginibacter xinganensis TaxID=1234841 RepID=A0A223NWS6_9SPHI|nr:hypothetical protein MuYL_2351 [Mucilaginibacter xinganensis]